MQFLGDLIFFWPADRVTGWGWYATVVVIQALIIGYLGKRLWGHRLSWRWLLLLLSAYCAVLLAPVRLDYEGFTSQLTVPAAPVLVLALINHNSEQIVASATTLMLVFAAMILVALLVMVRPGTWYQLLRRPHKIPARLTKGIIRMLWLSGNWSLQVLQRLWTFCFEGEAWFMLQHISYRCRLLVYYLLTLLLWLFRLLSRILIALSTLLMSLSVALFQLLVKLFGRRQNQRR